MCEPEAQGRIEERDLSCTIKEPSLTPSHIPHRTRIYEWHLLGFPRHWMNLWGLPAEIIVSLCEAHVKTCARLILVLHRPLSLSRSLSFSLCSTQQALMSSRSFTNIPKILQMNWFGAWENFKRIYKQVYSSKPSLSVKNCGTETDSAEEKKHTARLWVYNADGWEPRTDGQAGRRSRDGHLHASDCT